MAIAKLTRVNTARRAARGSGARLASGAVRVDSDTYTESGNDIQAGLCTVTLLHHEKCPSKQTTACPFLRTPWINT